MHLATRGNNKYCAHLHPHTSSYEEILPRLTRRTLAQLRTNKSPLDLWTDPAGVTALLAKWTEKLAGGPQAGTSDSPH